jgi:hypothetical protein
LSEIEADLDGTIQCLHVHSLQYKTRHVLITAGMDFSFYFGDLTYSFLESAFGLIEEGSKGRFKFLFSTVDDYFQAI